MAYVVQDFHSGDVLMANQLNEMDAQIARNEVAAANRDYIADAYDSTRTYSLGDLVIYNGVVYEATEDILTPETWASSHWRQATVDERIKEVNDKASDLIKAAINELNREIVTKAPAIASDASGSIATFNSDVDGAPPKSCVVEIDPVQDLHGQDAPYLAGGGKNLANIQNASITSQTDIGTVELVAGTYAVSFTATNSTSIIGYLRIINGSTTYVSVNIAANASNARLNGTFTLDSATTVTVRCNGASSGYSFNVSDIQIEAGSSATDYAPYANICPISGHSSVTVTRTGVNVWDEEWELGAYNTATGATQESTTGIRNKNAINVKPGTVYSIVKPTTSQIYALFYDADGNVVRYVKESADTGAVYNASARFAQSGTNYLFSVPSGAVGMNLRIDDATTYANNISINYPATDTSYHPGSIQSIQISLGQTVYGGTLDAVAKKLTIDRVMWTKNTSAMNNSENYPGWTNSGIAAIVGTGYNHAFTKQQMNIGTRYSVNTTGNNDVLYFTVSGSGGYGKTQTEWKALAIDVQILAVLAKPVVVENLTVQQITTLLGQNNIFASTGDIAVEYPLNTKAYIDSKNEETVTNLSGDITDLNSAKAPCVFESASGSIASFSDGADGMPIKSLIVGIDPVQDLHGYDNPWPGGGSKNLFNVDAINLGKSYDGGTNANRACMTIPVPEGTYTVSIQSVGTLSEISVGRSKEAYPLSALSGVAESGALNDSTKSRQVVINSTFPYMYIFMSKTGITLDDCKSCKMMAESGSTATDYVPYANICPISGHESVTVTRSGVNVWDEEWASYGSSQIKAKNRIPVIPGATYYGKCPSYGLSLYLFETNDSPSSVASKFANNSTFTVPTNCHYMMLYSGSGYGNVYNHDISINYPATDTAYHPGSVQSVQIPLGQTVYGGTLDVTNGVLTVDRGMYKCTGSETVNSFYQRLNGDYYFNINGIPGAMYTSSDSDVVSIMSDVYGLNEVSRNTAYTSSTFYGFYAGNNENRIRACVKDVATAEQATAWLTANTPTLVYELATPTVITGLTEQEMTTLLGQNNIFADTGNVSVKYPADTKMYIDNAITQAIAAALNA